jgi:hypothetical protein
MMLGVHLIPMTDRPAESLLGVKVLTPPGIGYPPHMRDRLIRHLRLQRVGGALLLNLIAVTVNSVRVLLINQLCLVAHLVTTWLAERYAAV